jgi:hypothetical protein
VVSLHQFEAVAAVCFHPSAPIAINYFYCRPLAFPCYNLAWLRNASDVNDHDTRFLYGKLYRLRRMVQRDVPRET